MEPIKQAMTEQEVTAKRQELEDLLEELHQTVHRENEVELAAKIVLGLVGLLMVGLVVHTAWSIYAS